LRGGSGKVVAERGGFAVFYRGRIEGGTREERGGKGRDREIEGWREGEREGEKRGKKWL
jgi:hypothetical protein